MCSVARRTFFKTPTSQVYGLVGNLKQTMRNKTNIPLLTIIALSMLQTSCLHPKLINISPETGENIRKQWKEFDFRNFNTTIQYTLDENEVKKNKQTDSFCTQIKNDLYYIGDFFRKNFYSKNGLIGIETVKCGYDECLPIKVSKYCNAKFIIYTDTSNNLTISNSGELSRQLIMSDKYYKESIYRIHFEIFMSLTTNYDEQTKIPITEVTFNTDIYLQKKADLGTRWVPVRDADIDEKQYQAFENLTKIKMLAFCDSLLTQRKYFKK